MDRFTIMQPTALLAGAYLHHLALESEAPEQLARFYEDAMDMPMQRLDDGSWLCCGPERHLIVTGGAGRHLRYAAFACRNSDALELLRSRAKQEKLDPQPAQAPLFAEGAFSVIDPDGNPILFGVSRTPAPQRSGLRGPLQHLTLATFDVGAIEGFYAGRLGFLVSDRVIDDKGDVATCFMRSTEEHHTLGCFRASRKGIDHHSYEAGEWTTIRDWADRFAARNIPLMWGPGRHGPGNNLFIFIEDPDGNWIEVSAELEVIRDRPVKHWPHGEQTLNLWGRAILRS